MANKRRLNSEQARKSYDTCGKPTRNHQTYLNWDYLCVQEFATQTLIAELCNSKEPECQKIIQHSLGYHSEKCESYRVYFFETDCSATFVCVKFCGAELRGAVIFSAEILWRVNGWR